MKRAISEDVALFLFLNRSIRLRLVFGRKRKCDIYIAIHYILLTYKQNILINVYIIAIYNDNIYCTHYNICSIIYCYHSPECSNIYCHHEEHIVASIVDTLQLILYYMEHICISIVGTLHIILRNLSKIVTYYTVISRRDYIISF